MTRHTLTKEQEEILYNYSLGNSIFRAMYYDYKDKNYLGESEYKEFIRTLKTRGKNDN